MHKIILKKLAVISFAFLLIFSLQQNISAQGSALQKSTPELQGVSSDSILHFLDALGKSKNEMHSIVIVRHGKIIAEGWWNPYSRSLKHMMYSMSKSFTSTAVGFAIGEGKLKLTDKVISFFPEILPDTISENLKELTVKDLLMMAVGQETDPTFAAISQPNWEKIFLALPIQHTPGSQFLYNSLATYMQSAIVQKVTGQKIIDYLQPRLFAPLDIQNIDWEESPTGINSGGWGLRIQTENMAKFGLLYLQKGKWNGKQILPEGWAEEATSFKIATASPLPDSSENPSDWAQGYCYQFWRCRNNAFRGDGAFGQYTIVMPDQDAVIAIQSETADMQDELNLVWKYLLPAMKEKVLPVNIKSQKIVAQKLAALALSVVKQKKPSLLVTGVSGKNFKLSANEMHLNTVSFKFQNNTCVFTLKDSAKTYTFTGGNGTWINGETDFPNAPPKLTGTALNSHNPKQKVAASYAWTSDTTLTITLRYIESPHHEIVYCNFAGKKLHIEFKSSLTALVDALGKREPLDGVMK